jgi:hypothetical protein
LSYKLIDFKNQKYSALGKVLAFTPAKGPEAVEPTPAEPTSAKPSP